jgi:hypothetical protein
MNTYGEVEVQLHTLTSTLDGGDWSASRASRFTLREKSPGAHWVGGWVGPGAGLDTVAKTNPLPCQKSNPSPSAPSLVTILTELSQLHYTSIIKFNRKLLINLRDKNVYGLTDRQARPIHYDFILCALC